MTERSIDELENVIEAGKAAYIAAGEALAEIQERKLYREQGYKSFEGYCKERWGFSRSIGYDYINAAQVAKDIETVVPALQFTQAVELSPLSAEQRREVAATITPTTTEQEVKAKVLEMKKPTAPTVETAKPEFSFVPRLISSIETKLCTAALNDTIDCVIGKMHASHVTRERYADSRKRLAEVLRFKAAEFVAHAEYLESDAVNGNL